MKHFSLVQSLQACSCKVSFSGHIEGAVHTLQRNGFIRVSVLNKDFAQKGILQPNDLEYNIWYPNFLHFGFIEYIKGRVFLHILIACPQLIPIEANFKLELDNMILFIDFNDGVKHSAYVYFGW